jgi:hypothetical protein
MDVADVVTGILLLVASTIPIGLGVAWYRSSRRVRELEARLSGTAIPPDARVDALERTVDTLTEQMEQLASGQEFLNRVVATQLGRAPGASSSPPVITPH